MSRLAASSAANLANDLSHALDVAEATNAELLQQLEEAEARADKVRAVRQRIHDEASDMLVGRYIWTGDPEARGRYDALLFAQRLLDEVDGL